MKMSNQFWHASPHIKSLRHLWFRWIPRNYTLVRSIPASIFFKKIQISTISLPLKQFVEHLVGSPMAAAAAAAAAPTELEWRVLEVLKVSEERGDPPLVRAIEAGRCIGANGGPSTELGQVLVSLLCFRNNTPSLWKLLDQAINIGLLSPLHILALLTSRWGRRTSDACKIYLEFLVIFVQYLGWFRIAVFSRRLTGFTWSCLVDTACRYRSRNLVIWERSTFLLFYFCFTLRLAVKIWSKKRKSWNASHWVLRLFSAAVFKRINYKVSDKK